MENNLETQIVNSEQYLHDLSKKLNIPYVSLLLHIWFNMKKSIVSKIVRIPEITIKGYRYYYNSFGNKIKDELDNILHESQWRYYGPDIYAIDPYKRNGPSKVVIKLPNKTIIISSMESFDPQMNIDGAISGGDNLDSVIELPDASGQVQIEEIDF